MDDHSTYTASDNIILYQSLKYFQQTIVMLEENLPYVKVDFVASLYESFRKEHSTKQIMTSKLLPHVCNRKD